jgi:hypothetical protein
MVNYGSIMAICFQEKQAIRFPEEQAIRFDSLYHGSNGVHKP